MRRITFVAVALLCISGLMLPAWAAAPKYTLTISVVGNGTTDPAPGSYLYKKNTVVTITAIPNEGNVFDHWEGALSGSTNPTSITMNADKSVTAVFVPAPPAEYTLTMAASAGGTTDPAPGPHVYQEETIVAVEAIPDEGFVFDHWEGSLTGSTNPDTVTMDADKSVTAVFGVNPNDPATALQTYVEKPDPNYSWNQYSSQLQFPYTNYFLNMTSQQWLTTVEVDRPIWTHYLIIQKPWFSGDTCVLLVDGGDNDDPPPTEASSDMGLLATVTGLTIADLKMIPNQPLYFTDEIGVARSEDGLLAYSFDKAATTGDLEWIGLLPMVKATLRGMDTVQAKITSINDFIVAGGSKRGWTTWLLQTLEDPRIVGIAPIVIDILNMDLNVDHIWESYGFYPPSMDPYVEFDIFCRMKLPDAAPVKRVIDPYDYFPLGCYDYLPKLLVFSGGDQFFCQSADQFYWDAVPGEKYYRRVPNTSHDLGERPEVLEGVGYWCERIKNGDPVQSYSWTFEADGSIRVQVGSPTPNSVSLWQITNPNARDFRAEEIGYSWTSSALSDQGGGVYVGYCPPPATGFTCFLVELDYGNNEVFTTQARVTPDILPYEGTHCTW